MKDWRHILNLGGMLTHPICFCANLEFLAAQFPFRENEGGFVLYTFQLQLQPATFLL